MTVDTNEQGMQTVSARELHKGLGVTTRFNTWVASNFELFTKGVDYNMCKSVAHVGNGATRALDDYTLTIDMAKELSMMSHTPKSKEVRAYFIKVEKQYNSPEMMMARSVQYANQMMLQYDQQIKSLNETIELQAPKVEFAETIQKSEANISVTSLSKLLSNTGYTIGRNKLFEALRQNGWLLKSNAPSQKGINQGLFKSHEALVKTAYGTQIKVIADVTPKGQEYFIAKWKTGMGEAV